MMNETVIYGFKVGNNILNHEKCVTSHCLKQSIKSNKACIHVRLAKHMNMQKSKQDVSQSDWKLVDTALQTTETFPSNKILDDFSKSGSYRLRYERHGELGKELIRKLFKKYKGFTDRVSGEAWTLRLCDKINKYQLMFENLCEKCEKSSSGNIYRLFALFKERKEIVPEMLTLHSFMSLLFALGHFSSSGLLDYDQFPKTIAELVAKYEFFFEFAERKIEWSNSNYHTKLNEKNRDKDIELSKYDQWSDEKRAQYLCQSMPCISKLWNCYAHNSLNLFSIDKNAILEDKTVNALYDENIPQIINNKYLVDNLKNTFTTNIRQNPSPLLVPDLKSPMPFPSGFEAVYHPFKHGDSTEIFFQGRKWGIQDIEFLSDQGLYAHARESTTEYLKMINEIILFDETPKTGIDQFTGETILKYTKMMKIRNRDQKFGVIIKCTRSGVSYLLTCYHK